MRLDVDEQGDAVQAGHVELDASHGLSPGSRGLSHGSRGLSHAGLARSRGLSHAGLARSRGSSHAGLARSRGSSHAGLAMVTRVESPRSASHGSESLRSSRRVTQVKPGATQVDSRGSSRRVTRVESRRRLTVHQFAVCLAVDWYQSRLLERINSLGRDEPVGQPLPQDLPMVVV
jgi:hypothetical protein